MSAEFLTVHPRGMMTAGPYCLTTSQHNEYIRQPYFARSAGISRIFRCHHQEPLMSLIIQTDIKMLSRKCINLANFRVAGIK